MIKEDEEKEEKAEIKKEKIKASIKPNPVIKQQKEIEENF